MERTNMFTIFGKKKIKELHAPVIGESVNLDNVPDQVFASRMMGEGMAFKFKGDTICSPCDAEVILIAKTKHAIGLNANGIEILIHVGLDTVNLNGQGFEVEVKVGDKVKQGDVLLKIDRSYMESQNMNLLTPMIITSKDIELDICKPSKVDLDSVVISLK
ncbi:PTS sugar transporter subunit IIA [Anaerorhabdus furcosa]|uniref:PTS system, glucose-specific IIA component n=1 Tax=Anaerorhabdus furcosa TaxID=118967 RepID=A0A1T4L5W3_9FIRM|nr:PTS glucose transporter subunit IIA [Anaerorhabdus furcosa]SJZ49967.1 PTS system, glucose-specific IIA component [Anaerorhabdus furcosa]